MFSQVQVSSWATHKVVLKPLLCYLGCVLRVVLLLETEPLTQSEIQQDLEQVIIKDVSVYVHLDLSPSSCCQKAPPQNDAAPTMLHCRDGICQVMSGAWFPPDMTPCIQARVTL